MEAKQQFQELQKLIETKQEELNKAKRQLTQLSFDNQKELKQSFEHLKGKYLRLNDGLYCIITRLLKFDIDEDGDTIVRFRCKSVDMGFRTCEEFSVKCTKKQGYRTINQLENSIVSKEEIEQDAIKIFNGIKQNLKIK